MKEHPSHILLYSIRTRQLPDDANLSNYAFCRQEVIAFYKAVKYLPSKILMRRDDFGVLESSLRESGKDIAVTIKGISIPIVAASAIQPYTIQLYPYIRRRLPLTFEGIRSPQ